MTGDTAQTLCSRGDTPGGNGHLVPAIAQCHTRGGQQRLDPETETLIPTNGGVFDVAHSLRADGFDASEDGTGRGNPLVPTYTLAIRGRGDSHELEYRADGTANALLTPNGGRAGIDVGAIAFDTTQITSATNRSNPQPGDPCHTLSKGQHAPAIAFSAKDHGADAAVECSPTLRAGGHADSHANAGVMPAVAFNWQGAGTQTNLGYDGSGATGSLSVGQTPAVHTMQVRRLTPSECEALQGFPRGYTAIEHRGKDAADGPRYKALGNSWAINCARWIGERIESVEAICAEQHRQAA